MAVGLFEFTFAEETGGGVAVAADVLFACFDDELAVFYAGVVGVVGVVMKLVVSPTTAAEIVAPF